jgi:hypothetical protein
VIRLRIGTLGRLKNGMFIGPGPIAVTEMPRSPNSFDAARVKCSTGALVPA